MRGCSSPPFVHESPSTSSGERSTYAFSELTWTRSCMTPHGTSSSSNGRGEPSASSTELRIVGAPSIHTVTTTGPVGGGLATSSTVPLMRQLQSGGASGCAADDAGAAVCESGAGATVTIGVPVFDVCGPIAVFVLLAGLALVLFAAVLDDDLGGAEDVAGVLAATCFDAVGL